MSVRAGKTVKLMNREEIIEEIEKIDPELKSKNDTVNKLADAIVHYNHTLVETEELVETIEKKMEDIDFSMTYTGAKMIFEPFIPEYLGFEFDSSQKELTIFHKEGWFVSQKGEKWGVLSPEGTHYFVKFENMYFGYAFLSSICCPVSIEDYLQDRTTFIDIEKIRKEAKELDRM